MRRKIKYSIEELGDKSSKPPKKSRIKMKEINLRKENRGNN